MLAQNEDAETEVDRDVDCREYADDTISETSCGICFPPPIPRWTQDMFCVQSFDSSDCTAGHIPNPSYMGVHKATVWNVLVFKPSSFKPRPTRLFNFVQCVWVFSYLIAVVMFGHVHSLMVMFTPCKPPLTYHVTWCYTIQCVYRLHHWVHIHTDMSNTIILWFNFQLCVCVFVDESSLDFILAQFSYLYYKQQKVCGGHGYEANCITSRSLGGMYGLGVWICTSLQW